MTSRSHTSSSRLWLCRARQQTVLALFAFAITAYGGTVTGSIELHDSQDAAAAKGKDFSGVAVWLEPAHGANPGTAVNGRARIVQKGKRFSPHISVVTAGTTIDFPNFDPIFHNAFSNFDGKVFDIGLYPPGTTRAVKFDRPGIVRVFCNIHPTMSAIIAVVDTPYFAVSRPDGSFRIKDIPAGEYTVHLFHERATPAHLKSLERRIAVSEGSTTIAPIAISETGYLPVTHKNKYGKEYPPSEENSLYPGARK